MSLAPLGKYYEVLFLSGCPAALGLCGLYCSGFWGAYSL